MSVIERAIAKVRAEGAKNALEEASVEPRESTQHEPVKWPMAAPTPLVAAVTPAAAPRTITLNRAALTAAGLGVEGSEQRRLSDQYRRIKRPILDRVRALHQAHSPFAQLIMLTSALPGDGKTFSSMNLALSIARERDVSVLLVDADVAKPQISTVLGLADAPGLLDALADPGLGVESLVLATDVPGLSLLPAGRRNDTATELLASSRMIEIANRLMTVDPRRIVLFDSPPLLLSSESRALAQNVGQVVMMVRAGKTPQGAVMEAIGHLNADKLTGLVLNECDFKSDEKHYGYGAYGEEQVAPRS